MTQITQRFSLLDGFGAALGLAGLVLLALALSGDRIGMPSAQLATLAACTLAALCLLLAVRNRQRLEALRASSRELERAQAVAHVGSWHLAHLDGDLQWSAETYRIFGVPQGERIAIARFYECVHPDDRDAVEAAWQRALNGEPYDIEHRIVVGGRIRWVHERAELRLGPDGHFLGATGTAQDVTGRHETEQMLRRSRQRLRALGAHHERLVEKERAHIAREIHDELGQYLTTLRLDAAMLAQSLDGPHTGLGERTAAMKGLIDDMLRSVRGVATALRPTALDLGLEAAIEWLVEDFGTRHALECSVDMPAQGLPTLDDTRSTLVFRILQEALTNVARHAGANRVRIRIEASGRGIELHVRDDGIGFDPETLDAHRSFGLLGMHERAMVFGGSLSIDSMPGRGTTIALHVPLDDTPMRRDEFPTACEGCPLMEAAVQAPEPLR